MLRTKLRKAAVILMLVSFVFGTVSPALAAGIQKVSYTRMDKTTGSTGSFLGTDWLVYNTDANWAYVICANVISNVSFGNGTCATCDYAVSNLRWVVNEYEINTLKKYGSSTQSTTLTWYDISGGGGTVAKGLIANHSLTDVGVTEDELYTLTCEDKLYILSAKEAEQGYFSTAEHRITGGIGSRWWLRTPGIGTVKFVEYNGTWGWLQNNYDFGVRPALQINLKSPLFYSPLFKTAAVGGKSSVIVGQGFKLPTTTTPTAWKLTVEDTSITAPTGVSVVQAPTSGSGVTKMVEDDTTGTVILATHIETTYNTAPTIKYSGKGSGMYISAIVEDAKDGSPTKGAYTNYAKISTSSSSTGMELKFGDLADGTYNLYVFSESPNGDNEVDYASPLVSAGQIKRGTDYITKDTLQKAQKDKAVTANISGNFELAFENAEYKTGVNIANSAQGKITAAATGGTTLTGNVSVGSSGTLTTTNAFTFKGTNTITGTLTGGNVTISGGTTTVGSAGKIANALTIGTGGTLVLNDAGKYNVSTGVVSPTMSGGTVQFTGGTLGQAVCGTGTTKFTGGTLAADVTTTTLDFAGNVTANASNIQATSTNKVSSDTLTLTAGTLNKAISGAGNVTIGGSVSSSVANFTNTGTLSVSSGTLALTAGTLSKAVTNNGTVKLDGASLGGAYVTAGTLEFAKTLTTNANYVAAATNKVDSDVTLTLNTGALAKGISNSGTVTLMGITAMNAAVNGGTLNVNQDLTTSAANISGATNNVQSSKTLTLNAGTLSKAVTNNGIVTLTGVNATSGLGAAVTGGTLNISQGLNASADYIKGNTNYVAAGKTLDLTTGTLSKAITNSGTVNLTNVSALNAAVNGGTLNVNQDLTTSGANINGTTNNVQSSKTLTLNAGTLNKAVTNNGTVKLDGASLGGAYVTAGTLEFAENLETNANYVAAATNNVNSGVTLTLNTGALAKGITNSGTVTLTGITAMNKAVNGGTLNVNQDLETSAANINGTTNNVQSSKTLTLNAGTLSKAVTNNGTVKLNGATLGGAYVTAGTLEFAKNLETKADYVAAATNKVDSGVTLTLTEGTLAKGISNSGTVTLAGAAFGTGGKISGGAVTLNGTAFKSSNLGTLASLSSTNAFYSFNAQLSGAAPAVDKITVTGAATGTLKLGSATVTDTPDANWAIGETRKAQYINCGTGSDITIGNTITATTAGYKYIFAQAAGETGFMSITKDNGYNLWQIVQDDPAGAGSVDTYALLTEYEENHDLGELKNVTGGTSRTLTIQGNKHKFSGGNHTGIATKASDRLDIVNVKEISGWAGGTAFTNAGTLNFSASGTGAPELELKDGISNSGTVTFGQNVNLTGTLSGAGSYVNNGTMTVADASKLAMTGTAGLTNTGGTVNLGSAAESTLGAKITGGTLNVNGNVTSKADYIAGGTNNVASGAALTLNAGTLAAGKTISGAGTTNIAGDVTTNALVSTATYTVGASGNLTTNAQNIGTSLTVNNGGFANLTGGTLAADKTISGAGTTNITGDVTTNAKVSTTTYTVGASGNLTTDAQYIGTSLTVNNGGFANLTGGTLAADKTISGAGATNVNGVVTTNAKVSTTTYTIGASGNLTTNAQNIGTSLTVNNGGFANLTGGTLAADKTISGTGATNITGDVTTNAKVSTATYTVGADSSLTTDAQYIGSALTDNGAVNLTAGTLSKAITGTGSVKIDGEVTSTMANLGNTGTLSVADGGILTLTGGTLAKEVTNAGTVKLSGAGLGGAHVTAGTLEFAKNLETKANYVAAETNKVDSGVTLTLTEGTLANAVQGAGTVKFTGGELAADVTTATLDFAGNVTANANNIQATTTNKVTSGTLTLNGGTLAKTLTGAGNVAAAGDVSSTVANLGNTGTLSVADGGILTLTGGTLAKDITNAGTVKLNGAGLGGAHVTAGTLEFAADLTTNADYISTAVNKVDSGVTLTLGEGTLANAITNLGTVKLNGATLGGAHVTAGTLEFAQDYDINAGCVAADVNVAADGTALNLTGGALAKGLTNNGSVTAQSGVVINSTVTNNATATAELKEGAEFGNSGKISGGSLTLGKGVVFSAANIEGLKQLTAAGTAACSDTPFLNLNVTLGDGTANPYIKAAILGTDKADGEVKLGKAIFGGMTSDNWVLETTEQIQYLSDEAITAGSTLTVGNRIVQLNDGNRYIFTQGRATPGDAESAVSIGYIDVRKEQGFTLKETINNSRPESGEANDFTLISDDSESITAAHGGDLGGLNNDDREDGFTFTISGMNTSGNNYTLYGNGFNGIVVADPADFGGKAGDTLNLEDIKLNNFKTVVTNKEGGIVNLNNVVFEATGTMDIVNDGTLALSGTNEFDKGVSGNGTIKTQADYVLKGQGKDATTIAAKTLTGAGNLAVEDVTLEIGEGAESAIAGTLALNGTALVKGAGIDATAVAADSLDLSGNVTFEDITVMSLGEMTAADGTTISGSGVDRTAVVTNTIAPEGTLNISDVTLGVENLAAADGAAYAGNGKDKAVITSLNFTPAGSFSVSNITVSAANAVTAADGSVITGNGKDNAVIIADAFNGAGSATVKDVTIAAENGGNVEGILTLDGAYLASGTETKLDGLVSENGTLKGSYGVTDTITVSDQLSLDGDTTVNTGKLVITAADGLLKGREEETETDFLTAATMTAAGNVTIKDVTVKVSETSEVEGDVILDDGTVEGGEVVIHGDLEAKPGTIGGDVTVEGTTVVDPKLVIEEDSTLHTEEVVVKGPEGTVEGEDKNTSVIDTGKITGEGDVVIEGVTTNVSGDVDIKGDLDVKDAEMDVEGNVEVKGNVDGTNSEINVKGKTTVEGDVVLDNSKINSEDITVKGTTETKNGSEIKGKVKFEGTLSFNLDGEDKKNGYVFLSVNETADLSKVTEVRLIQTDDYYKLNKGETMTLITKAANYKGESKIEERGINGEENYKYIYSVGIENSALMLGYVAKGAADQTKSFSEARLAGSAALNSGSDLVAGQAIDSAAAGESWEAFAAVGGSRSRYETGSHVDLNSTNVAAGLSKKVKDNVTLGIFVEGGNGRYTTYNEFETGTVRADGDINYFGGGVFAKAEGKKTAKGQLHGEASFRAGHMTSDYNSETFNPGESTRFDTSNAYMGAHAAVGYKWNVKDGGNVDTYVKYLWNRQNGDSPTIKDEQFDLDAINSHRLRAGFRYNSKENEKGVKVFGGLAYEYEFDGKASGHMGEYAILEPDFKDGSGIAEVGIKYDKKGSPWKVELGLTGATGKRDSIGANLNAWYEFGNGGKKAKPAKPAKPAKKAESQAAESTPVQTAGTRDFEDLFGNRRAEVKPAKAEPATEAKKAKVQEQRKTEKVNRPVKPDTKNGEILGLGILDSSMLISK